MSEKPKCPWLRFHLLTAVLMMIAAGGLVAAKCEGRLRERYYAEQLMTFRAREFGFPCTFFVQAEKILVGGIPLRAPDNFPALPHSDIKWGLYVNLIVMLLVLAAVALLSEYLIRRREGRKP